MKALITLLLLICQAVHSQPVLLNGVRKGYIETGINLMFLNYSSVSGGGGTPMLGLPMNFIHRNPLCQIGITSTILSIGSANEPELSRILVPHNINVHFGYNIFSLFKKDEKYAGPFVELGLLKMNYNLNNYRGSLRAGLQFYIKNKTRISLSLGGFTISEEQKNNENQNSIYNGNFLFSFEISHSFPFRLPAPKSAVRQ